MIVIRRSFARACYALALLAVLVTSMGIAVAQDKWVITPGRGGADSAKGMVQIQTLLNENADRKSETTQNAADIDALEGRMGTAEGNISTLQGTVSSQGATISNHSSRIGTLESGLADVEPHAKAPMPGTCHDQNAKLRWNTATSAWECLTEGDPTVQPFAKTNLPTCSASQLLRSNGSGFQCVNAGESYVITESDPKVGAVTSNQWCRGTGSQIACDQPAPTSNDPRITTLSSGKSCTSNGTEISCTASTLTAPPTCSGSDKALQWTGSAWDCATLNIAQEESSTCVDGGQIFTVNTNWSVPLSVQNCPTVRILAVANGSGGMEHEGAGGCTGDVKTLITNGASLGQAINITVPNAGGNERSWTGGCTGGSTASIGGILSANGHVSGTGSCGGGSPCASVAASGSGYDLSIFKEAIISVGSGGSGGSNCCGSNGGGGGSGGVLINGAGPQGGNGQGGDVTGPGTGGTGYGAGGGGGGYAWRDGGIGAPGVVYIEWSAVTCTSIGQSLQGGICATTGTNALIAASTDAPSSLAWGSFGTTRGTTSTTNGLSNTATLAGFGSSAHPAAHYCSSLTAHGYDDWYLPASDELAQLYQAKALIGGFSSLVYWSSTEYSDKYAWYREFTANPNNNYTPVTRKDHDYRVRCVRRAN